MNNDLKNKLFLKMRSPESIFFDGEIVALSSVNDSGPFDILANHANFICIVKDKVTIHLKGEKKEIPIERGALKVEGNMIHIFLGLETV